LLLNQAVAETTSVHGVGVQLSGGAAEYKNQNKLVMASDSYICIITMHLTAFFH
jgi:hypothetical protein